MMMCGSICARDAVPLVDQDIQHHDFLWLRSGIIRSSDVIIRHLLMMQRDIWKYLRRNMVPIL